MFKNFKLFWRAKKTLRVRLTAWYILFFGGTLFLFSSYLYLQLKYTLLSQIDTTLEVTASEIIPNLIVKNNSSYFPVTESFQLLQEKLTHTGFAARIVKSNGQVGDSFGNFSTIGFVTPKNKNYVNLTTQGTIWRIYSIPLVLKDNQVITKLAFSPKKPRQIWLQVAQSLQPVSKALDHLLFLILFAIPLVLFLASVGGLFLANRALSPINQIIHTAETIRPDDFSCRINYQGVADEVGRLAMTLDRMLDRIESAFEHERRFIANASHELRTPLTVIKGKIGVTLIQQRNISEYKTTLQDIESQTDRLIRLTNGLLFLAHLEQEEMISKANFLQVDLSSLLEILVEQIQSLAVEKKIDLQVQIAPNLFLLGNNDLLISLFLNLLDNAVKYTSVGGQVKLTAKQEQQQIVVIVSNTGKGIASEHLPYIFERFYRIESDRSQNIEGTGLGLAIAALIVRCHSGQISVDSQVNKLTTFKIILPCRS